MQTGQIHLYLTTWETTVEHAFSWSFFDKLVSKDNLLSHFLSHYVSTARNIMQRNNRENQAPDVADLGFLMCDFYSVALLINEKCGLKFHDLDSTVELNGIHSRGAVFYDWYGETGVRNARLVTELDKEFLENLLLETFYY